jgi:molecular chaperone HtpG
MEVLFMYDPWDEFVMEHLYEFDGKTLRAAEKAELNVGELEKKEGALSEEDAKDLAKWLKEKLAERVGEVRVSQRLVDSPAVVVEADKHLTSSMRRILKAAKRGQGQEDAPDLSKQDLEINPRHAIMVRLQTMRQENADLAAKVAEQVLDNARVAAGLLEDPRTMLKRLNELLEQVLVAPAK